MADTTQAAPSGRIAFFRAGRHTSVDGRTIEFTPEQLADAAGSYDAAAHEAPFVVGHPELNAPAYGWAGKLEFRDGTLYAQPKQVNADFAAMVNAGSFKKVSASWYLPDSPGNPKPGKLYLRHIGFLGAAPPALKGLPDASFAANDGAVTVEFAAPPARAHKGAMGAVADLFRKVKGHLGKSMPPDQVNGILPDWQISSVEATDPDGDGDNDALPTPAFAAPAAGAITTENDMSDANKTAEFAEREAALKKQSDEIAARDQALKDRETAIATAESAARKKGVAEFVESLAKDGRILPRHAVPMVEVLCAFAPDAAVSFAEGDKTVSKNPGELLREFLQSLPPQISFAEKSGDDGHSSDPASFAAPAGMQVDASRLDLHHKALAYQRANKGVSYLQAVHAAGGR